MNLRMALILTPVLLSTLARADGLLSPAQFILNDVDQGAPGVYAITTGSGGSVTFTSSPNASVLLTANGSPDLNLNSPTADLRYFFEFVTQSGTPTPIPLLVDTTMSASFVEPPGGSGNDFPIANASLQIDNGSVLEQGVSVFGTGEDPFSGTLSATMRSLAIARDPMRIAAMHQRLRGEHGAREIALATHNGNSTTQARDSRRLRRVGGERGSYIAACKPSLPLGYSLRSSPTGWMAIAAKQGHVAGERTAVTVRRNPDCEWRR